jgi:hypothetical protein
MPTQIFSGLKSFADTTVQVMKKNHLYSFRQAGLMVNVYIRAGQHAAL